MHRKSTADSPGFARYAALFALALVVRLLYIAEWKETPLATVLIGDGRQYDLWARAIASGDWVGSQVFYQAPLYPYFMATVYTLLGQELWTLRLVQCLLGSISCLVLALAGRRFFSPAAGLAAGLLLALYPPALYFDGLVQKGVLGGLMMTLLLFTLGEALGRRSGGWLLAAGITLGAFALARENALVLPPLLALWIWLRFRKPAWIALLLAGTALVLVPVGLRNQAIGGRFLLTTSQAGSNFYIGNHPGADGRYQPLRAGRGSARYERRDAVQLAERAHGRSLTAAEVSRYWFEQSREFIRSEPAAWLSLLARKTWLVWHADEIMDTDSIEAYREASMLLRVTGRFWHFGILVPLALVGIWITRDRWRELSVLYLLLLAITGAVALFFVMARYRFPLVPVLALFAGAALVGLVDLRRSEGKLGRGWIALTALVVFVAAFCNWPIHATHDPRTVTYYSLGAELVDRGRIEEGLQQLERARAIEPDFADVHHELGEARRAAGQAARAIEHYREALRLDERHATARTGWGLALVALGRPGEAADQFREAIRLEPDNVAAHNNLATLLAGTGQLAEAARHLERALEVDGLDPNLHVNLGKLRLLAGDRAGAATHLRRALELDRDHAEASRLLGMAQ